MAPRTASTRTTAGTIEPISRAVAILASKDRGRLHAFPVARRPSAIGGGSGADDPATEALRTRIRAALASGVLPPLPGPRSWVGRGSGHGCAGCGDPLRSTDLEHEVEVPGRPDAVRVHIKCYLIWKAES